MLLGGGASLLLLLLVSGSVWLAMVFRIVQPLLVAAVVAAAWPVIPRDMQGPVLLELTYSHGVHTSDLLTPALLAVVAFLGWRLRRH